MDLVDSHCHLDAPPLGDDPEQTLAAARQAGVRQLVVPGVTPAGWPAIARLAELPGVFAAFGVHPQAAEQWEAGAARQLRELAGSACAIGEIGLDFRLPGADRQLQLRVFREQLAIAGEHGLPVIIHCRDAFAPLLEILREVGVPAGGVMHAFSGSLETARECLQLGLAIGIAGPVTWGNAVRPRRLAAELPLERLLLETDAPDLTPAPHQGEANRPAWLPLVCQRVAELRAVTAAEVAAVTAATARRILHLPPPEPAP